MPSLSLLLPSALVCGLGAYPFPCVLCAPAPHCIHLHLLRDLFVFHSGFDNILSRSRWRRLSSAAVCRWGGDTSYASSGATSNDPARDVVANEREVEEERDALLRSSRYSVSVLAAFKFRYNSYSHWALGLYHSPHLASRHVRVSRLGCAQINPNGCANTQAAVKNARQSRVISPPTPTAQGRSRTYPTTA
ncbi:hypothetical protein B0H13DRAFT_1869499 [Mycena leptocephala]|nr:hypothetical protein B0H13DRAFT_1869499 [Mycena leptocephala]